MNVRHLFMSVRRLLNGSLFVALILASSQASRGQGLVSWWPGNGNFNDIVGGHDGTPIGGVEFLQAVYGKGFFWMESQRGSLSLTPQTSP